MVFCRGCGKEIHETAPTCPHCGCPQILQATTNGPQKQAIIGESKWMGITSMVIGIFCVLMLFADSKWDNDEITGLAMLSITGLVFGIISLAKKRCAKGMAIAGIVLASIGILAAIGMSAK